MDDGNEAQALIALASIDITIVTTSRYIRRAYKVIDSIWRIIFIVDTSKAIEDASLLIFFGHV